DDLRRAVDQVLGLLEAEVGDLADGLDDADLVRAGVLEGHRELGLLDGRGSRSAGPAPHRGPSGHGHRGCLDAPLRLELLGERGEVQHGHLREEINYLFFRHVGHFQGLLYRFTNVRSKPMRARAYFCPSPSFCFSSRALSRKRKFWGAAATRATKFWGTAM